MSLAQLLGTSLWFSANSAGEDLSRAWNAGAADIGWLTNAVQAGFILGTLALAFSGMADRFRASTIFVGSALAGAVFNVGFAWLAQDVLSGSIFRFLVGLSLAGIYPIGMKLIVSWEPDRTGQALALLVAMLTLGTALPHFLRFTGSGLSWRWIITCSSLLALLGAALIQNLGTGPHLPLRKAGEAHQPRRLVLAALGIPRFRAAATGYFGHMWELYSFWTVVPLLLAATGLSDAFPLLGVAGLSFFIIAAGALGCLAGGVLSRRVGSARVALGALAISGSCIILFALAWQSLSPLGLLALLLIWGTAVVADSPQFSALSARACPSDLVGGALALQNAIGFTITMVSIWAATAVVAKFGPSAVAILAPGPVLGLWGFARAMRNGA
ncbi:MFS transporter [Paracoccus ravus]|uniref:MFS transporter n=1 Tax=Paracoccus ravus TaxID=2447760 RepID=UPI001ADA4727|nr:MFS transporter [Paracoccus ravus]